MKYHLIKKGHGKYAHLVPKEISDKKAEYLENQGEKVYDSKKEAKEHC